MFRTLTYTTLYTVYTIIDGMYRYILHYGISIDGVKPDLTRMYLFS